MLDSWHEITRVASLLGATPSTESSNHDTDHVSPYRRRFRDSGRDMVARGITLPPSPSLRADSRGNGETLLIDKDRDIRVKNTETVNAGRIGRVLEMSKYRLFAYVDFGDCQRWHAVSRIEEYRP